MSFTYFDSNASSYWYVYNDGSIDFNKNNYSLSDYGASLSIAETNNGTSQYVYLYYDYSQLVSTATSQTAYASGDDVAVRRQTDVITNGAGATVLRVVETVTNTGTAAKSFTLSIGDDLYADAGTTLATTSSGDAAYGAADDWYVTSTSSSTYPYTAHVVSAGTPSVPVTRTRVDTDTFQTDYQLDLEAGASASVVHFYALGDTQAAAVAQASDLANLPGYAIAGLAAAQLDTLVNVSVDVTSAATTTLAPYQRNLTLTGKASVDGTGNGRDNVLTGNAGANTLSGLDGSDTLDGGAGKDRLVGGKGDDTYVVDASDVVVENNNEGIDTIRSAGSYALDAAGLVYVENLTLLGSAASGRGNASANVIVGNAAANTLTGLGGNDTLDGGAGKDRLVGGLDDDTYLVDNLGDVVVEAAGEGVADTVVASVSGYALSANVENLTLVNGAVKGTGNGGDNVLTGNAAVNQLIGLQGNDTYYVDQAADQVVEAANQGTDTVVSSATAYTLGANVENLILAEGSLAARATGNAGANVLTGNSGNNTLDGRGGSDTMSGGAGGDTYFVDSTGDVVIELAGQGIDTVRTGLSSYTLGTEVENGVLLAGGVNLTGNVLNNALTGNGANNTLRGFKGNDQLLGGGGDDTLDGGEGNDVLVGDAGGPDSTVASGSARVGQTDVTLNLSAPEIASGTVVLSGSISSFNLTEAPLNVVYVIDHSGSMSDAFSGTVNVGDRNGDGVANTTLDAAIASFESLNASINEAGLGNQVRLALVPFESSAVTAYTGSPVGDADANGVPDVIEAIRSLQVGGGTNYTAALQNTLDFLDSQGSGRNLVFFVSDGAPNDRAYETSILPALRATGQGGTLIRAIGTGAGASEEVLDILDDGLSNDSAEIVLNPEDLSAGLTGAFTEVTDGAFVEIYRNGTLVQVIGSDEFTVTPLGIGFKSGALAVGASGTDTFKAVLVTSDPGGATVSTALPVKIGTFTSSDTLNGGEGDDLLDGGIGADRMDGGAGDDTFVVDNAGDTVTEAVGAGQDRVISRLASYTLGANVEDLTLSTGAVAGAGNALDNTITGNDARNRLSGGDGDDTLSGGLGADTLNGGTGDDRMIGGDGDDSYVVDSRYDSVEEAADGGIDQVTTVFDTSLGGYVNGVSTAETYYNVERLVLAAGSAATAGVGNDDDNVITGNANANTLYGLDGDDTLIGGAGADHMDGGAGNDTYHVQDAGDVVVDAAGIDTVVSFLRAYTLGTGIERLTLAETAGAVAAIGNAESNVLTGNAYDNVLAGGGGADTMTGGRGNDTYRVDNVGDRVVEAAGGGIDTVTATVSYKLAANVENGILSAPTGNHSLSGNAASNVLTGNAGANRVLGLEGDDTLDGGLGNDLLNGGAGADTFVFKTALGSGNIDHIVDFSAADDTIQLSQAVFTKLAKGALSATAFKDVAKAALDADDRIVYDSKLGTLAYDADGNGTGAAVQFAILDNKAVLTAADLFIV